MGVFKEQNKKFALILNPEVGTFKEEFVIGDKVNLIDKLENTLENNPHFYAATIMNKNFQPEDNFLESKKFENQVVICKNVDDLKAYKNNYGELQIAYNIILENSRLKRKISGEKVKLCDNFTKLSRNTDYSNDEDEFYSDDHIYFRDDEYVGFSDYSVVGESYSESGFAPYAVAIHIVYFDQENNLRIRHFVSDSNLDPTNPAGKFKEALTKLVKAVEKGEIQSSLAIEEFRRLYDTQSYPGLGTVKKLSIMHHLELVGNYLDEYDGVK
ncbi:sce7725 family protein [Streptococcus dysgalactiae subsp. equisimilis]